MPAEGPGRHRPDATLRGPYRHLRKKTPAGRSLIWVVGRGRLSLSLDIVAKPKTPFQEIIGQLEAKYGRPKPPEIPDPLEMILLENVAYLVSDEQRETAFNALRERVGTAPTSILSAQQSVLLAVTRLGGMHPERRVKKLRLIVQIALEEFQGNLRSVLAQPLAKAKKSLKIFAGLGDPGAEKILLFSKAHAILALESNGLRALVRLGFGNEQKSYATTYRSTQEAVKDQLEEDCAWLIRAHQLFRRYGQEF